ncbi:MAG: hypothetical protein AAFO82_07010 [Bacteroidota bacterium]
MPRTLKNIIFYLFWIPIYLFVIVPLINYNLQKKYEKFYALEGSYIITEFRRLKSNSEFHLKDGSTFLVELNKPEQIQGILEKGDTLVKVANKAVFEISKQNNESYSINYNIPLVNLSYWDLMIWSSQTVRSIQRQEEED